MEFLDEFRIPGQLCMQDLHCHHTIQYVVMCFIYIGHTAATDLLQKLITMVQNAFYHGIMPSYISNKLRIMLLAIGAASVPPPPLFSTMIAKAIRRFGNSAEPMNHA